MSEQKTEKPAEVLKRLRENRDKRKEAHQDALVAREIEHLQLAERFDRELGKEGSEFAIVDTGHPNDPLVVVKRPALVQWTKYEQSNQTPTDRYDFVAPSVVHPSLEEFNGLREKRIGVEIQASNALARLMGLQEASDQGK